MLASSGSRGLAVVSLKLFAGWVSRGLSAVEGGGNGFRVEATEGALDLGCAKEGGESTLDLKDGGVG